MQKLMQRVHEKTMRKLVETIYVASFDQRGSGSLRLEATKGGLILVFK